MAIEWTADLATGNEVLDTQHRELYGAVAKLHDAMREGRLEHVRDVLNFLSRYVVHDFSAEEAEAASGYAALDEHRAAHQDFIAEYRRQFSRLTGSKIIPSRVLISTWLGEWLRDHVRRADGSYGSPSAGIWSLQLLRRIAVAPHRLRVGDDFPG